MSLIDREDFGTLYATHAPRVRRMLARRGIRNEGLDDALQEAFETIHRLLPGFEGRSSIDTWLHGNRGHDDVARRAYHAEPMEILARVETMRGAPHRQS